MFTNRSSDRPVRHLEWRVRLFGVAAILAIAGIGAEIGWLVNLAIVVLAGTMLLGWVGRARAERGAPEDDEDDPLGAEARDDGTDPSLGSGAHPGS